MTKAEIVAELESMGLDFDPSATKAELKALLPASEEADEAPVVKGAATVLWRGGSRTYTKEEHGADYKALAQSFAEKKGGSVT